MPLNIVGDLLGILDKLIKGSLNRIQAEMSLKSLAQGSNEFKFAKSLNMLVTRLPRLHIEEDVNETRLCMRFVDPFLTGLFDDSDSGAKQSNGCIDRRPGLCTAKSCAKPAARDGDHYLVCIDLVRMTVLSKEALNKQCLDGVLGIQIVGRTLMFYVLLLPAEGIYTLLQLAEVKIPDSLQSPSYLVMDVSNTLSMIGVFDRLCVCSNNQQIIIDRKTPTDRKRQCHLKRRHN
ncbi:hypothetical protein BCV72DRAFT_252576 [Rhizopus microsporus var. microsporus]|uniref:Uncharacterized protein n=1 Tax=Rhizopus microsporus var. microsporus TaxID=86635 RepID=A0A1X0QR44_RHIZD|nr:hypothetical protein BCV72DRAFT_252576 [Rhizopus microsporus var. microsporus]